MFVLEGVFVEEWCDVYFFCGEVVEDVVCVVCIVVVFDFGMVVVDDEVCVIVVFVYQCMEDSFMRICVVYVCG